MVDKESETLRGSIDRVDTGLVFGWAAANESNRSLSVHVICNDKVIGSGCANIYRNDLEEAGIHQGQHGFSIDILSSWPKDLYDEVEITVIDADTLQPILGASTKIKIESQGIYGSIIGHEGGHLVTTLASSLPLGDKTVVLYHQNIPLHQLHFSTNDASIEIRQPIPLSLQDGKRRLFKIGILGMPEIIATACLAIDCIQTPWQYLKESYNKPNFLSYSNQADSRYESLRYQLDALAANPSKVALNNLLTVHDVVVEGYEARTKYPAFSLPLFEAPEVSIIVPAFNNFALTYHCIASIALAFNKTSFEVILADDCSSDETTEAGSIIDNLVISRSLENLRFLKNCNRASRKASGKYIIFLNNDTEVTSFWIDELIGKMECDADIGMTGSKLLNSDGTLQEAGGVVWDTGEPWNVGRDVNALAPEYNYTREVDYLTGAAVCILKSLWLEVGLFSEEFAPCYYEDTDLAFKVRRAGYKTVYVPHSVVVHFEGKSHGTDITTGLKHYQVVNEKTFRQKWFKAFSGNGSPSLDRLRFAKDRNIDQRILMIDYASPMPNKDAGSYAAVQEMKLIQSLGFKVTFVPANLAHFGKFTTELQSMGVEVLYAPFYHSIAHVLEARLDEMDAVYITRYDIAQDYIDYIHQHSNAKVIFNNADLHFLREMRAALKGKKDQAALDASIVTQEKELTVCRKADAILCYNSTEHAVITSHIFEAEKLHITPWVLEPKSQGPEFNHRHGITFLGGFNHAPNGEAVSYLIDEIMPLLEKQRPEIILYVYGSNMPTHYKDLETNNVKMVGFSESLDDVYHNHRVFVAPLLSGAGIKGKVLESMAYNLPTVLSEIAAEGTGLTHGISTLIADEPQEWVDSIIKLYDDLALWEKFAENSQTLVEVKYSFQHAHSVFKGIFASVGVYSSK